MSQYAERDEQLCAIDVAATGQLIATCGSTGVLSLATLVPLDQLQAFSLR